MSVKKIVLFSFFAFFCILSSCGKNGLNGPLIWNVGRLDSVRKNPEGYRFVRTLLKECDIICKEKPIAITDKQKTFAPNPHYYCSIGTYWWPDSLNKGQYVNRDGHRNPESQEYDNKRLGDMVNRCKKLSVAYYLKGEQRYYDAFVRQLQVWFVNKETYMLPNFEYAQVVPGRNGNNGRSSGLISIYGFNTVLECIRLVSLKCSLDKTLLSELRTWFKDFAKWADEGKLGNNLRQTNNNIVLAYDVTLVNMFLFGENEQRAKEIADEFADKRVYRQIDENGRQAEELKRTKAFSYSVFNLTHVMDFCYLVRYWYPDYYQKYGKRVDKAFDFLFYYSANQESFPYKQIVSWRGPVRTLKNQLRRRDRLKGKLNLNLDSKMKVSLDDILLN